MARDASERLEVGNKTNRRDTVVFEDDAPDIGFEEFNQRYEADPRELFDHLVKNAWKMKDEAIAYKQLLERKEAQVLSLIEERDEYQAAFARKALQEEQDRTRSTTPVPEALKKSIKLADPPTLTDGKTPRFEDWLTLMKHKLEANADHFTTEKSKIAYIRSRTGEEAAEHLAARMEDDATNKYRTAEEVLDHLTARYRDPNRKAKARREFRDMRMTPKDNFNEFLSKFLRLAGLAGIPEDEHKEELYDKLTYRLREMMTYLRREDTTFEKFAERCADAAESLELNVKDREQSRKVLERNSTNPGPGNPRPARVAPSNRQISTAAVVKQESSDRLNPEALKRHREGGLCFRCHDPGHLAVNCPTKKTSTVTLKEIEPRVVEVNNDSEKENP